MATRESTDEYYRKYHSSDKAKKDRAARNKARRAAERRGDVHKGDDKEVHHVKALANGGSRALSNTRVTTRKKNRSYSRTANNKPK